MECIAGITDKRVQGLVVGQINIEVFDMILFLIIFIFVFKILIFCY